MTSSLPIMSDRLILRSWTDADRHPFAELSQDSEAMRYLTPLPTRQDADAWIDRQIAHQAAHGFCFWAVALRSDGRFVGSVGLLRVGYQAHFTPAVEIGWRLAEAFWRQGYAVEAARASLRFGFATLELPEIVANAGVTNANSRRVMERLGMTRNAADDFDHPRLAEGDPLRRQVLYRLTRPEWRSDAENVSHVV